MEINTELASAPEDHSGTGSLTTIAIKTINPPLEGDDSVLVGKIAAIGAGTLGAPPWPVTVQMTYMYLGQAIAPANLGTYFNPIPSVTLTLTGPNIYCPYSSWALVSPYVVTDFTAQGCGQGTNGPVCSSVKPMLSTEDDKSE